MLCELPSVISYLEHRDRWLALLLRIREILSSNPGRRLAILTDVFHSFP
jgi:hypothetical protein